MGRPARRRALREDGPQRHRVRRHAADLRGLLPAASTPSACRNDELYDVFAEWNRGELDSYLIEITRDIFSVKDPETGDYLVDKILDTAGAKGTGKWMSQLALDLGVPSTLVTEAVYARCLSALKDARVRASKVLHGPAAATYDGDRERVHRAGPPGPVRLEDLQLRPGLRAAAGRGRGARLAAELRRHAPCCGAAAASSAPCSSTGSRRPSTPTPTWRTCCSPPTSREAVDKAQDAWRHVVATAVDLGIPVPAFATALAYYDGYRRERLPANLLQAQRDYFGAHTYERIDKPGARCSTPSGSICGRSLRRAAMPEKIQMLGRTAFCCGIAVACSSCSPKVEPNNQRLVACVEFYLINYGGYWGGYWELKFDSNSKLWLLLPDGSTHYVPDIDQPAANDLPAQAKSAGDTMATKSGDIAGNPDRLFNFWRWGFELRFNDDGRLQGSEIVGKSTTWEETTSSHGELRTLPNGVVVGMSKEGPFSDLVGDIDELENVFGEPNEIRHYEPPRGP